MKLGITGYPLTYTKSPDLHRRFLRQAKLSGSYGVHPFNPKKGKKAFFRFLDSLRAEGVKGLNITMPFKEWAFDYADGVVPGFSGRCARLLGSANTLVFGRRVLAANTDAEGFWGEIGQWLGQKNVETLIIGSGGAAKGLVAGILAKHPQTKKISGTRVWGRKTASAAVLERRLPVAKRRARSGAGIPLLIAWCIPPVTASEAARILGNAGVNSARPIYFYDLNYGERAQPTKKLASSKKWRCKRWREGSGMLERQARASFQIWTNR